MDGFDVDPQQLRTHAGSIEALRDRFGAVKTASANVAQNDAAYGLLCGWIAGVLESRHTRQDELIAYVEENLTLVAESLRDTADDYETQDGTRADEFSRINR
jgi:hypothetical protein